jgi:hypothetical protein
MKILPIVLIIIGLTYAPANAQTDSLCTLTWVENQSGRIDSMLNSAIRSQDPVNMIYRLMDAYLIFDAVVVAGLNCPNVREAAVAGRHQTDVVNYRIEKDLNSMITRSTMARYEAEKMRLAAQACPRADVQGSQSAFSPRDIIIESAVIVELDLTDGLAAGNFHILSQKVEHAIRTLHDIEHIAATLDNCSDVIVVSRAARLSCENIQKARNWTEVKAHVDAAVTTARSIKYSTCK